MLSRTTFTARSAVPPRAFGAGISLRIDGDEHHQDQAGDDRKAGDRAKQRRQRQRFVETGHAAADEVADRRRQEPHAHHQARRSAPARAWSSRSSRPGSARARRWCAGNTWRSATSGWRARPSARAGGIRIAKPRPTNTRPQANLVGADGSVPCAASLIHTHAITGANRIRKNEFIDWNQLLGKSNPNTLL